MLRSLILPFILTALLPVIATAADPLVVLHLTIDAEKQQVAFDVENQSSKSIHSWTMTIVSQKKRPASGRATADTYTANMLTNSQACADSTTPLLPGQTRHCQSSAYSGEPATLLSANVDITAVLFEDRSATGDLALLDKMARARQSTIRALDVLVGKLEPCLSAPTSRLQLESMQKALQAPDADFPADLRYDPTFYQERENLRSLLLAFLQGTAPLRATDASPAGTIQMLKQRAIQMRSQPDLFPPRIGANLLPPSGDPLLGWRATGHTAALQLVAVSQPENPITPETLFLQNFSPKPITAIAVGFGSDPHGSSINDCFLNPCLLPGASREMHSSTPGAKILVIQAAIFEDGTADGEPETVDQILYSRLGRIFETERVRALLDAPDADLATLTAKIGPPPQSPQDALTQFELVRLPGMTLDRVSSASRPALASFLAGVRNARQDASRQITEAQRAYPAPGAALENLRRQYRQLSDRYRAYCERVYASRN